MLLYMQPCQDHQLQDRGVKSDILIRALRLRYLLDTG
jgi:uncharacterized protein YijF (DUF1287 family)